MKDFEASAINCDCASSEHVVLIRFNSEDREAYIEVQLSQYRSFFKRLVVAIKYLFGYQCKYGHWDTTILNEEKIKEIRNSLSTFLGSNG